MAVMISGLAQKISDFRSIFSKLCFGLLFNLFYQITIDLKIEKGKKSILNLA